MSTLLTGHPTKTFRASNVQRRYRDVLDSAKKNDWVEILDSDEEKLVIRTAITAEFERALHQHLLDLAQFVQLFKRHQEDTPTVWAGQCPYPWLRSLSKEEVVEFAQELQSYLFDAAQRNNLDAFIGNLQAWRSTAELYEQPDILKEILHHKLGDAVEVLPPEETESK